MKLWLNNRLAAEYERDINDLASEFLASEYANVEEWPWPLERRVGTWLSMGLSSTIEREDQVKLVDAIDQMDGIRRQSDALNRFAQKFMPH